MWINKDAYDGVEIVVRLAIYRAQQPCTAAVLARWINAAIGQTEGLLAALCDAGLVRFADGPETVYHLKRPADEITLAEVFAAFDDPLGLPNRPLNAITFEPEEISILCGPDLLWEDLKSLIFLFLSDVTVADISPETDIGFVDERVGDAAFWHHAPSTAIH